MDSALRMLRMAVSDHPDAKQSVTTFRVLERFMAGTHDDGYTLVECKLQSNIEIKRKVVGQVLAYASGFWRMSYDEFRQQRWPQIVRAAEQRRIAVHARR